MRQALMLVEEKSTRSRYFKVVDHVDNIQFKNFSRFHLYFLGADKKHTQQSIQINFRTEIKGIPESFDISLSSTWFVEPVKELRICDSCKSEYDDTQEINIAGKAFRLCTNCTPFTEHEFELLELETYTESDLENKEDNLVIEIELEQEKCDRVQELLYCGKVRNGWTLDRYKRRSKKGKLYYTWVGRKGDARVSLAQPRDFYTEEKIREVKK